MSNLIPTTTAAASGTPGLPSYVVSTGISTWSSAGSTHGALGTAVQALAPALDIPNPVVVRARVAAKQDRPPRGVPR